MTNHADNAESGLPLDDWLAEAKRSNDRDLGHVWLWRSEALIAEVKRLQGSRTVVADALREAADAVEEECIDSKERCFCGSADWLRARAAQGEGCDCTELCEMGPTCPGGTLAGLPGSGCHRVTPPGASS